MPVLPEVGSISTVCGPIAPAASIASIIDTPMRSFTLPAGLKYSSLARISAWAPCMVGNRRSRTSGVSPIASVMEAKTRPRPGRRPDACAALLVKSRDDILEFSYVPKEGLAGEPDHPCWSLAHRPQQRQPLEVGTAFHAK